MEQQRQGKLECKKAARQKEFKVREAGMSSTGTRGEAVEASAWGHTYIKPAARVKKVREGRGDMRGSSNLPSIAITISCHWVCVCLWESH